MNPVIAETVRLCTEDDRTARQLCADAGVCHNIFTHWRRGGATIAVVDAVLGAVGYKLAVVKKEKGA